MNNDKKIEWEKCQKCGFLQHSSHLRCLKCKHEKFDRVEAIGNAKLLSYTILKAPPAEFYNLKSYPIGIVEFENGVKALGQITSQDNLKIGMNLNPKYKKICDSLEGKEVYGIVFETI